MKEKKGSLHMITFLLLVIGGLNWLLVGLFSWDIGSIFGGMDATISRIIYILVGLSAIYEVAAHKKMCSSCSGKCSSCGAEGGKCSCEKSESKPEVKNEDDTNQSSNM